MKNGSITILRWGLAFVFFYAAIASLAQTGRWMIYVPSFIAAVIPPQTFLVACSFYELILAGLLFSGKKIFWSSLLAAISFVLVVIFDFRLMGIIFENVGLAFAALALFDASRNAGNGAASLHRNHNELSA